METFSKQYAVFQSFVLLETWKWSNYILWLSRILVSLRSETTKKDPKSIRFDHVTNLND